MKENCPLEPDIDELRAVFGSLVQKLEMLIGQNYTLMRLMLIALIFLALGKGGLDIWREIRGMPSIPITSAAQK